MPKFLIKGDSAKDRDIMCDTEYFCRIFSEAAKLPPVTYLNRLRVQKSMELLTATDLTIQEICGRCGFGSAAYYDRIFRRFQGQTPKEYRSGKEKSPFLT